MGTETKEPNRELDSSKKGVKRPRIKQNYTPIQIGLTEFQTAQVKHLCKEGVARSPTDFVRIATLDKIRINKNLLPERIIPPKQKSTYKVSQTPKAKKHRKDKGLE